MDLQQEHESETTTPSGSAPPIEALRHVFAYFQGKSLWKLREVCVAWKDAVNSEDCIKAKDSGVFNLNSNPYSIHLFNSLTLPWKNFRFLGTDLESELFGHEHPDVFRRFSLNYGPKLHSLTFVDCNLPTGRFYELLAFCKQIQRLTFKNSPSIFQPNMGLFRWGFCFKNIKANLAGLKSLILINETMSEDNLVGLADDMTHLEMLHVKVTADSAKLPAYAIGRILQKNCDTLRQLIISGELKATSSPVLGLFPLDLQEMAQLRNLRLQNFKLSEERHGPMLATFLSKCPALQGLAYSKSHLHQIELPGGVLERLKHLDLLHNTFEGNAFNDSEFPILEDLRIQAHQMSIGTINALKRLLEKPKPKVICIDLELMHEGGRFLKLINPENTPNLSTLILNNCVDIVGAGIRFTFRSFPGLKSLSITNCKEIVDDSLCPILNSRESLANLRELKFLDLSDTKVGDETVKTCIIGHLLQLEVLILNKTLVTSTAVHQLLQAAARDSLPLKVVSAKRSKCKFSKQEFKTLVTTFPNVEVQCQVILPNNDTVECGSAAG